MKNYRVNVNGTVYEVSVEEIGANEVKAAPAAAPAAKPAAPAAKPAAPAGAGEKITAPMPGNILSVNVSAGQEVKKGDVLMVLEAMKMENEIMAPKAGKVTSVAVSKGSTVATGDLLCTVE